MDSRIKFSLPLCRILDSATNISKYHHKKITGKEEFIQALSSNQDSIAYKITDYLKNEHNIDIINTNQVKNPIGFTPEILSSLDKARQYAEDNSILFLSSEHIIVAMAELGIIEIDVEIINEAIKQIKYNGYS